MGLLDFFIDAVGGASTAANERFAPSDQHRETSPGKAHAEAKAGSGWHTGYSGAKAWQDNNRGENDRSSKRWRF
jgi:hypothetical protein